MSVLHGPLWNIAGRPGDVLRDSDDDGIEEEERCGRLSVMVLM